MSKKFETYLHNHARKMLTRTHARLHKYDEYSPRAVARAFYGDYGSLIRGELLQMSLEVRAKIAAEGKAYNSSGEMSLEGVHLRSSWVNGSLSGEAIITEVATTAIVAAIYDLIMEDRQKRKYQPAVDYSMMGGGGRIPAQKAWSPSLENYDRWMK